MPVTGKLRGTGAACKFLKKMFSAEPDTRVLAVSHHWRDPWIHGSMTMLALSGASTTKMALHSPLAECIVLTLKNIRSKKCVNIINH